jgi:hypothetical protein
MLPSVDESPSQFSYLKASIVELGLRGESCVSFSGEELARGCVNASADPTVLT